MKTKVLITGCNGFIGRNLEKHLKDGGFEVYGIDIQDKKEKNYFKVDLNSKEIIHIFPDGIDIVVHLAAISNVRDGEKDIYNCLNTNILGTLNLFKVCKEKKVKQFIFASTEWVYGDFGNDEVKNEDSKINIEDLKPIYSLSKYISELNLKKLHSREMDITILRFGIIYGSRLDNWSAVESIFNDMLLKDRIEIGSSKTGRNFIHVDDICFGIEKCFNLKGFNILNLEGEKLVTLKNIIDVSTEILKKDIKLVEKDKNNPSIRNVENKRIYELTDWKPKVGLKEGLSRLLHHFKENDHEGLDYKKWIKK